MPRKTKDNQAEDLEIVAQKKTAKKVASKKTTTKKPTKKAVEKASKKATTKKPTKKNVEKDSKKTTKKTVAKETKKATTRSSNSKKTPAKSSTAKKTGTKSPATKKSTTKSSSVKKEGTESKLTKKSTSQKSTVKNTTVKKATAKKVAAKKSAPIKETSKKSSKPTTRSRKKQTTLVEYYDLPNHYEQTIVKILAQTPTILFVYWNISDKDTKKLLKQYGENFFYETSPFLIVINKTKNYQFEVEINDYANSWYLHIPDSDCEYEVVLVRKYKNQQTENYTVSITSSNNLETPNDHILFEKLGKTVFFQNVKTQNIEEKNIFSFGFMHNIGRIYNIYDLYKEIYKDELSGDELNLRLPSS